MKIFNATSNPIMYTNTNAPGSNKIYDYSGKSNFLYRYNLASDVISFKRAANPDEGKQLFSCKDSMELAEKISDKANVGLNESISKKFKNGESYVNLMTNVEDKSIYVVEAGSGPINDNLMEFRQIVDAAKRDGAEKITAIIPYMPYSRQDRISKTGESIAAKMVAEDIQRAGADKIITVDLHSVQTQGFYNIPCKNLSAMPLFANYFRNKGNLSDFAIISPDFGGEKRAKALAKELDAPIAIISKERSEHNKAEAVAIFGNVKGKNCILIDDMIDTAGTITEAVKMLKNNGAKDVYICATHGIFSDNAYENIKNCPVKEVIVTDTLPLKPGAPSNVKQISISSILAKELKN